MKNKIYDITGRIDTNSVNLLKLVSEIFNESGIGYFIIGAFAKEILLNNYYGFRTSRFTEDIDICVAVKGWREYNLFVNKLIDGGGRLSNKIEHNLYFEKFARQLDVLPYGFEGSETIKWQISGNLMDISIYRLIEGSNITLRIAQNPEVMVNACSLVSLFATKLMTWYEMYPNRSKDALDLFELMENYKATQKEDRYFEDEIFDKIASPVFDELMGGCFMLGVDIAQEFPSELVVKIISIIEENVKEGKESDLITIIASENRLRDFETEYLRIKEGFLQLLAGLKSNFNGIP